MAVGRRMTLAGRRAGALAARGSHTGVQQRLFRRQVHLTVLRRGRGSGGTRRRGQWAESGRDGPQARSLNSAQVPYSGGPVLQVSPFGRSSSITSVWRVWSYLICSRHAASAQASETIRTRSSRSTNT